MSLINDALNKAQRDRAQTYGSTLYRSPGARPRLRRASSGVRPIVLWTTGLVAAALLAGGIYFRPHWTWQPTSEPSAVAVNPPPTVPAPASPAPRGADTSPFGPPPEMVAPATAPQYELTGMSAMGSTTLLSIVRQSDKRSLWVPVGKTVGEVTAVSYDPATDRAVIRVNGAEQTIALRDVGTPASQPAE